LRMFLPGKGHSQVVPGGGCHSRSGLRNLAIGAH
jgi:hypothetical protein